MRPMNTSGKECDKNTSTLIINDRYGALACALPQASRWLDSQSAAQTAEHNLQRLAARSAPAFLQPKTCPRPSTEC